jgi:membrane protein required for colicin V production
MNGLDVAIVVVAVLGAFYGLGRGVLRMATSLISLGAALYLASLYYLRVGGLAAGELHLSPPVAAVIGFVVVFFAVFVAVELAGSIVARLIRTVHLSWIDRLLGAAAGCALTLVIAGFALMLATAILPAQAPLLRNSTLAPRVMSFAQGLVSFIPPEVEGLYQRKREQLERYWLSGGHQKN